MLEKAAEALARELGADWEMAPPSVRAKWIEAARAALLAIRDPDQDTMLYCLAASTTGGEWRSIIDAITKE